MRPYTHRDWGELCSWYSGRGLNLPRSAHLSDIGLFEPMIGAGWLYTTNSKIAFIDGLISNVEIPSKVRGAVLIEIGDALMKKAVELGFQQVVITTQNCNIKRWASDSRGFIDLGQHHMLSKEI